MLSSRLSFPLVRIQRLFPEDIASILVGCLVLIFLIVLDLSAPAVAPYTAVLRIPLSLLVVFFIPGYLLQVLIFPLRNPLDGPERLGLSLGLSLALISILALLIDRAPWRIDMLTVTVGQVGVILLLVGCVGIRRNFIPGNLAYMPNITPHLSTAWSYLRDFSHRKMGILFIGLFFTGILLSLAFVQSARKEVMTEFYVLGPGGLAEDYPRDIRVGEPLYLTVGINNLEGELSTYSITFIAGQQVVAVYGPLAIRAGQHWQGQLSFEMLQPGQDQPVEILLNREDYPAPYRALRLWLNIQPAG